MSIFSKLQPVFIVSAALAGIAVGKLNPFIAEHSSAYIEIFLMIMLFFVFLSVDIGKITRSFRDFRFSLSSLLINFVWTPLFAFALSKFFLSESIDLQIGFIMLMVTPCTDWYLIFTGLAGGNAALGSSVLPLNLILQIVLLPAYLFMFMGASVSFELFVITKSIGMVLIMPLLLSTLVKLALSKSNKQDIMGVILSKSDDIQLLLLCLAIIAMFASQGSLLLKNLFVFLTLLIPLLIFFVVNFILAYFVGNIVKQSFQDTIPLIFTTSARNSPVSLAIATITFPFQPVIMLVLVIGPLIELPVLAVEAFILKRMDNQRKIKK
ncbi:MAG: bile acid:sodium symporter [Synergistaceae bacterium]|nr:bile acid:sodium symporter [Synergistaceae bacterium]